MGKQLAHLGCAKCFAQLKGVPKAVNSEVLRDPHLTQPLQAFQQVLVTGLQGEGQQRPETGQGRVWPAGVEG